LLLFNFSIFQVDQRNPGNVDELDPNKGCPVCMPEIVGESTNVCLWGE